MEPLQVHSPLPKVKRPETPRAELLLQGLAADEGAGRGAVKTAQPGVAHGPRNRPSRPQVLGVSRVIRSRERDRVPQTVAAHRKTDRPFGRNVNRMRAKIGEHAGNAAAGRHGQPDLRVARTRDRTQSLR